MGEAELARQHQARIEPVDRAHRQSLYWVVGGLAGMIGGLGAAAAIEGESPTAAAVFGVSGLVIGLGGVIGALAVQPSAGDQLLANGRRIKTAFAVPLGLDPQ